MFVAGIYVNVYCQRSYWHRITLENVWGRLSEWTGGQLDCDYCHLTCEEAEYEKFLSQAIWPGDAAQEKLLNDTKAKYPQLADQLDASRLLLVQVYYSSLISQTIQTQVGKIYQAGNAFSFF